MNTSMLQSNRRRFLRRTAVLSAGAVAFSLLPAVRGAETPARKVRVGVMGVSRNSSGGDGRGAELAVGLASLPGVEVAYVCDVDERNAPQAAASVVKRAGVATPPRAVRDFRRILEDSQVDALLVATPDHWHAPAAILACAAGKHVYVEKPCCHNAREGELLVAAARKHQRCVQQGTQRRSWPVIREAMDRLHSGEIGRILFAKAWYYGPRPSIGQGKAAPVPGWLDYELWQGPAAERPYRDNYLHYHWHWFWHWGTGELGNNGVHTLDLCRWGLGVDFPLRVTSSGGKYRFPDDDQETPDTNVVSVDFDRATVTWEQRSWAPQSALDPKFDVAFYGEKGILTIGGNGYSISDPKGKELLKNTGAGGNQTHLGNFIDAIRGEARLNAEIEEGYRSTLLCHLGNIAYRTGRTIHLDPKTRQIANDPQAAALWGREYRPGWEPKV